MRLCSETVALVTGGANGIGKATCSAFLARGVKVSFLDVNLTDGENTLAELKERFPDSEVFFTACDITNGEDFARCFENTKKIFGCIDIVCNIAGFFNEKRWAEVIAINLQAVIQGTQLALGHMRETGHGVVINVSSIVADYPAYLGGVIPKTLPVYTATKAGVLAYSRCIGEAVKMHNLRVVCVCPFTVDTKLYSKASDDGLSEDLVAWIRETGVLSPEQAAEGILKAVEDEDNSGKSLKISVSSTEYMKSVKMSEAIEQAQN